MTTTTQPIRSVRALRELADYLEALPKADQPHHDVIRGINETLSLIVPVNGVPFTRSWDAERILRLLLPGDPARWSTPPPDGQDPPTIVEHWEPILPLRGGPV